MNNTPHNNPFLDNFDDNFNIDLPGEIEDLTDENCGIEIIDDPYIATLPTLNSDNGDDFSWILPDGETIEDHIPDFYYDEEEMGYDGDFYDSDALTSAGWGEDEAYGCFE